MKYPRGVVLLVILIFVVLLMVAPRLLSTTAGSVAPTEASIAILQPIHSTMTLAATPSLPPAPISALPTSTLDAPHNPSPTPMSFDPMQLQTVAPQATLTPNGTAAEEWKPPPLEVPLAYHWFDHYWFIRPVGSNNENSELSYYPYGSDGPRNDLRIHHGIDLANPIGVQVFAAGDGTVIWADKGHFNEFESITAYGNTIVIEHDFGYNGQHIYTLYAHLSAILVKKGEHVQSSQVIGLTGNTGAVTGPHVHFEVRVWHDSYSTTRNPVLWMAPYLGTGVIAGRITFPDGGVVADALIMLIDCETGRVIERVNSYAGFGVNGDNNWEENFVFADVPVGCYFVTSRLSTITWSGKVNVVSGVTNWVQLERSTSEESGNGNDEEEQP